MPLHYALATGVFTWRIATGRRIHVGDIAGSDMSDGYRTIGVDGGQIVAKYGLSDGQVSKICSAAGIPRPRHRSPRMLTQEYVRELFHYEPETGVLHWSIARSNCIQIGEIAGCIDSSRGDGYRVIWLDGHRYKANQIIWLWMTGGLPKATIDHMDRDSLNDRWKNFREATASQQAMNRGIRSDNHSGYPGVYWNKPRRKWHARIYANGQDIHHGYFNSLEEAVKRCEYSVLLFHGEFTKNI